MSNEQTVQVAISIIHYGDHYLLGYRNAQQHQGNCYEFIGGKVEGDESPIEAMIRELNEEIGLRMGDDFKPKSINKLGIINHDYGDKNVCLYVFRIHLSKQQYTTLADRKIGTEKQKIVWVDKFKLLAGAYPLPAANNTLLKWLALDDTITITYSIEDFRDKLLTGQLQVQLLNEDNSDEVLIKDWLTFHKQNLPNNATVYVRHKMRSFVISNGHTQSERIIRLLEQLCSERSDLSLILSASDIKLITSLEHKTLNTAKSQLISQIDTSIVSTAQILQHVIAQHLSHDELVSLVARINNECQDEQSVNNPDLKNESRQFIRDIEHNLDRDKVLMLLKLQIDLSLPIIASCHDEASIMAANTLSKICLAYELPPVLAIFISPVRSTLTHPNSKSLGWDGFAHLANMSKVPAIGLGGLSPDDLLDIRHNGGDKVAGIRQFMR